jgi:hypothetical protein
MFPPSFARGNILSFSNEGDLILDPFCGRGTTVLEALLNGRQAIGVDINPVAAVVSRSKVQAPPLKHVINRIDALEKKFRVYPVELFHEQIGKLPQFFWHAYTEKTLQQVLFLREHLDWRRKSIDRFICALVLGHLHGESESSPSYLSNQMPHTIAPKLNYSMRYWQKHGMHAPERNAFDLLRTKATYRLEGGIPKNRGLVINTDARNSAKRLKRYKGKVAAVITSPPYLDVTRFEEDQWLRLWFLGGEPQPTYGRISKDDRHKDTTKYFSFLTDVWNGIEPLMKPSSILVCRIGTTRIPFQDMTKRLCNTVNAVWPKAYLFKAPEVSALKNSQTDIIRPGASGCKEEYDFCFKLS